ncbi:MAG: energy-coupling factor ABC transporter permease [Methanomassiliicoccaceae archaeon]|jgi:cobalamin biosynthesis protein CbiM/cobalt ECF transporter T component CbiQ|nr:energy-coupling factor ABC transporter permease [Methanomassiliicoccaceae archaeon]
MHIMEGFLPIEWALFWLLLCIPFLVYGIRSMRKLFAEQPEKKLTLALSGAFIVILSSLKIPSVTGSSSHPTGTGMGVMFSGPAITAVICTIVLLFQGMFMAHGGPTTLGANVFSMGIAGPFAAYAVYRLLRKRRTNPTATVFITVFVADIVTYTVTALQLALIVPFTDLAAFIDTYITFFGIFTITQVPIAIAEGVLMIFFFRYLADIRPELVKDIGFDTSVRNTKGIFDSDRKVKAKERKKGRAAIVCFAIALAALIFLVYFTTFFNDIGGADDAGADAIWEITGNGPWTENLINIGEFGISLLFIIQTAIGVLILAAVLYLLLRKEHDHGSEFNTVDTAAYKSPMLRWSPLAKLLMVLSLLVVNIIPFQNEAPFLVKLCVPLFTGLIGLSLFLYASSFRPPRVMMKLFVFAQVFIIIGAAIFTIVISEGEMMLEVSFFGITLRIMDEGVFFAALLYAKATAALFLMFAFAVSTPVPHLSSALKKMRLPDVFVEMMILIYRYTFLLMESAERMHLAAECRFGYSGFGKSMRTTAKLTVGVFMRSLDTAERGQVTLQCRNYKGDFRSLSESDGRSGRATALCALIVCVTVMLFLVLRLGVLP